MGDWRQEGLQGVVEPLLGWYDEARRTLPGERTLNLIESGFPRSCFSRPVDTVIPYFERFMAAFPTIVWPMAP